MRIILKWILKKQGLLGSEQILVAGTFVYEDLSDSVQGGPYFNLLKNKDLFLAVRSLLISYCQLV
jgi:hypothetical protein